MYARITFGPGSRTRGELSASTVGLTGSSQAPDQREERGGAFVLVTLCLAMVLMATMLVAEVGERTVARARAQSAADASSLAGVSDGRSAAMDLATANGAQLVSFEQGDNEVSVVVEFEGVRAAATAERRLVLDPGE